jgi:hypothetical protein
MQDDITIECNTSTDEAGSVSTDVGQWNNFILEVLARVYRAIYLIETIRSLSNGDALRPIVAPVSSLAEQGCFHPWREHTDSRWREHIAHSGSLSFLYGANKMNA